MMINEQLKTVLEAILPTYHYQMPAGKDAAITYQPYYAEDAAFESGTPMQERWSYRITVFQRQTDLKQIQQIVAALRAAGWVISHREWMIDPDGHYYQHSIDIDKWEVIT